MWTLSRPRPDHVWRFLEAQRRLPPSYHPDQSAGFQVDQARIQLGSGERTFLAACEALHQWQMFPSGWTGVVPARAPIAVKQDVAILARVCGVWWSNACRITSVTDEVGATRRFGFTYVTLPGHVAEGEEEFLIEWDADDLVWYQIRAVSRPRYWLARIAFPLTRWIQFQFRQDSLRSMQASIHAD